MSNRKQSSSNNAQQSKVTIVVANFPHPLKLTTDVNMTTSEFFHFKPSDLVVSAEDFANLSHIYLIWRALNENPNRVLLIRNPNYRWNVKGGPVEYELQHFHIQNDGSTLIKCFWCPVRKSEKARRTLQKRKSDHAPSTSAPKMPKVIEMVTIDDDDEPAPTVKTLPRSSSTNHYGSHVMHENPQLHKEDNEPAPTLNAPSSSFWNHHQANVKIENHQEELINENQQLRATITILQNAILNLQQQFDDFKDEQT